MNNVSWDMKSYIFCLTISFHNRNNVYISLALAVPLMYSCAFTLQGQELNSFRFYFFSYHIKHLRSDKCDVYSHLVLKNKSFSVCI